MEYRHKADDHILQQKCDERDDPQGGVEIALGSIPAISLHVGSLVLDYRPEEAGPSFDGALRELPYSQYGDDPSADAMVTVAISVQRDLCFASQLWPTDLLDKRIANRCHDGVG